MRFLIVFIIFCSHLLAATPDPWEKKKGFVLGVGGNISAYKFPVQFEGQTKNSIDETQTLYGPAFSLGYDFVFANHLLLGLRADGLIADTYKSGGHESDSETDKTTGKLYQGALSLRVGYVFQYDSLNLVADTERLTGEFFIEAGLSSGHKSFRKKYTNTSPVNETYDENLEEEYQGRILAAGINIASRSGTFFEFKVQQSSILKNKQTFSGTQVVNGGAPTPTDKKLEDENRKSFPSILITVGHHY